MDSYFGQYVYLNNAGGAATMDLTFPGFEANMRDCDAYMSFSTDEGSVTVTGGLETVDDSIFTISGSTE